MCPATMMLVSTDASLIEAILGALASVPKLQPIFVAGIDEARARLDADNPCVVLVHQAQGQGIDPITRWLHEVGTQKRTMATLVVSDRYDADQALALHRLGIDEYLSRPLDPNRLAYLLNVHSLRARYAAPASAADAASADIVRDEVDGEPFLYANSQRMGRLMEQVRRVAPQDATVLLGGDTGTGKTRLARLIHQLSARRAEPFLAINCGALSATLIESEMFGHVRGAFTSADRDRTGKFAAVGRGTLFLDEVDALPPALQAKLLRVIEERTFEPVGSNKSLAMEARLVAASNRALEEEVAAGRFRADLFYRLNVVSFTLPLLRERPGVIPALVRTFAAEFSSRAGRSVPAIGADVMERLEAHPWPGNIRELRNAIERAVTLSHGGRIVLDDLPDALRPPGPEPTAAVPTAAVAGHEAAATLVETKEQAERSRIREALVRTANNRLRAAAELGISRMTLYKKLHKYGLIS